MGAISNFLFGDNSNKTSYKQAAYDKYYQQAMGNVMDKIYDDSDEGMLQKLNTMTSLNDTAKNSLANYNATKNQTFGNGLIGSLLNPVAQTVGAVGDLAGLGLSGGKVNAWDKNNDKALGTSRDWLSDLGAAGETALDIATLGSASGATAGAKTLGQTVAKGALTGAGYGLTGGLNEMGAENFDAGQLALGTAIGAGVGGGLSGLGYGVDKLANNAKTVRSMSDAYNQAYANSAKNGMTTNLLGDGAGGATAGTASNATADWLSSRGKLAGTKLGQAYQGLKDKISYGNLTGQGGLYNIANSKLGKTASNLLSSNAGKVGAGLGGGLLLSKLLNSGNSSDSGLTDEELQELYNYYYGGQ